MGAASLNNTLVVLLSIVAVGLVLYPDPVSQYLKHEKELVLKGEPGVSALWTLPTLLRFMHLVAFATNFGASLWVSFIGGIIMFKHLPRHQFGNLQAFMFPAFFRLSAVGTAINLAILGALHPWSSSSSPLWEKLQFAALGLSLLFTLTNLLVMEPVTTKLMRERHRAEKEDGISTEPGVVRKKEIEKAGPKLRAINKKFGAAHGISSLINLFAFWGLFVHAGYLANRLLV